MFGEQAPKRTIHFYLNRIWYPIPFMVRFCCCLYDVYVIVYLNYETKLYQRHVTQHISFFSYDITK